MLPAGWRRLRSQPSGSFLAAVALKCVLQKIAVIRGAAFPLKFNFFFLKMCCEKHFTSTPEVSPKFRKILLKLSGLFLEINFSLKKNESYLFPTEKAASKSIWVRPSSNISKSETLYCPSRYLRQLNVLATYLCQPLIKHVAREEKRCPSILDPPVGLIESHNFYFLGLT